MHALADWSLDDLWQAHQVLDALDRVDAKVQRDAMKAAERAKP